MLLEILEAGKEIPIGTKKEKVAQVMEHLLVQLNKKINQHYSWLAVATKAVDAGAYGGKKRKNRRLKLRKMIQACALYLNNPDPTSHLETGWERQNLFYGYNSVNEYALAHNVSEDHAIWLGMCRSENSLH